MAGKVETAGSESPWEARWTCLRRGQGAREMDRAFRDGARELPHVWAERTVERDSELCCWEDGESFTEERENREGKDRFRGR